MPAAAPTSQMQERAVRTRASILEATVASLIDQGYAATTTSRVLAGAGVSRGALLHHFPSKQDLLLAAVDHLAAARAEWFTIKAAMLPEGADRIATGMSLLWSTMSGPLFAAATELWVASRTDEDLRRALLVHERKLGEAARTVIAPVLGAHDPSDPRFIQALDLALQTFRGASLTALLRDDARWEREVVAHVTESFRRMWPGPDTTDAGDNSDTSDVALRCDASDNSDVAQRCDTTPPTPQPARRDGAAPDPMTRTYR